MRTATQPGLLISQACAGTEKAVKIGAMREKPDDGQDLVWETFEDWANDNAIGFQLSEWLPYWKCWDAAHLEGFSMGY